MQDDSFHLKYPTASSMMDNDDFQCLVEVFRTLSKWRREARSAMEERIWIALSLMDSFLNS